jgi:hypothetical protein
LTTVVLQLKQIIKRRASTSQIRSHDSSASHGEQVAS